MFRQKVKISSLFTDELFTAKVRENGQIIHVEAQYTQSQIYFYDWFFVLGNGLYMDSQTVCGKCF